MVWQPMNILRDGYVAAVAGALAFVSYVMSPLRACTFGALGAVSSRCFVLYCIQL